MDTTKMYPFKLVRAPCLFGWWLQLLALFFFFSDFKIVSHSSFACNQQNRFQDSEPIIARFPSNKGGNSDIRIPCNSVELQPALCIVLCVVCCVYGLGPSHMSKQNVLSLILFIPLVKLTNQKRGICRHYILYPLRLEPPFPNDVKILRPKVGLEPNQITN